jgi:hypothetical protein
MKARAAAARVRKKLAGTRSTRAAVKRFAERKAKLTVPCTDVLVRSAWRRKKAAVRAQQSSTYSSA